MKKLSLLLVASAVFSSSCLANGSMEVKLQGAFDFQAAVRHQKKLEGDSKYLTNNQKNAAFFSQSALRADASNTNDQGFKYGAVITIKTTSKTKVFPGINGSHLFGESDFGKVELGSRQNAPSLMQQSAYNICMGTCDDWTKFTSVYYGVDGVYNSGSSDYGLVYSGFGSNETGAEQIRTATYYTPKFNGLQLGVSYSPDTANSGDNGSLKDGNGALKTTFYDKANDYAELKDVKVAVKDLIGAGVTFEHNLADGVDVILGAGVESGKAAAKNEDNNKLKLSNHKLYNLGAVVSYGNWSVAASYADAGKSLTSPNYHFDKRKNRLYTGGLAYNQGPMGISLTYLHNDRLKNKMDAYTLGTQYKLAPGFMPYFEVTSFKIKNKGYDMSKAGTATPKDMKTTGMVYMFGTKVSF